MCAAAYPKAPAQVLCEVYNLHDLISALQFSVTRGADEFIDQVGAGQIQCLMCHGVVRLSKMSAVVCLTQTLEVLEDGTRVDVATGIGCTECAQACAGFKTFSQELIVLMCREVLEPDFKMPPGLFVNHIGHA